MKKRRKNKLEAGEKRDGKRKKGKRLTRASVRGNTVTRSRQTGLAA